MEPTDKQWKNIYLVGGICTIIVLAGIILDIVVGNITAGDITSLPQTATGRFYQIRENWLFGLYTFDLLNTINQIVLIPSVFALYAAHRKTEPGNALLALILFVVGVTIFVTNNTSLTMLDLSRKYFEAATDTDRNLIAAAGEAMLAKGQHGSSGVFIGFALPTFANGYMSLVMIRGKIFGKINSYIGFTGNTLMLIYIILVTFIPAVKQMATAFAMPGGILLLAWMIMYTIKLFKLRTHDEFTLDTKSPGKI